VITCAWMRLQDRPRFGPPPSRASPPSKPAPERPGLAVGSLAGELPAARRASVDDRSRLGRGASPTDRFESADTRWTTPWRGGDARTRSWRGHRDSRPERERHWPGAPTPRTSGARLPARALHSRQLVCLGLISETFETAITWTGSTSSSARSRRRRRRRCEARRVPAIVTCRLTHVYPDGQPLLHDLAPAEVRREWRSGET